MIRASRIRPRHASRRAVCILALLLRAGSTFAAQTPVFLPDSPKGVGVTPHVGRQLPLSLPFIGARGEAAPLSRFFDGEHPVVLVPRYARCITLCGLAMQNLLRTLSETGLPASAYRVVSISIDPTETAEMAGAQSQGWRAQIAALAPPPALPASLRGGEPSIAAMLDALGVQVGRRPDAPQDIAHPAIAVVTTPGGLISGYVGALDHDSTALRRALVAASDGQLGTTMEKLKLRCAHLDPLRGRYSAAVLKGLQALGLASSLWLGVWLWQHRHGRGAGRLES